MICEDANLNYQRADKLQQGRNAKSKQAIYAALQKSWRKSAGLLERI
jgi:hypothetical protein